MDYNKTPKAIIPIVDAFDIETEKMLAGISNKYGFYFGMLKDIVERYDVDWGRLLPKKQSDILEFFVSSFERKKRAEKKESDKKKALKERSRKKEFRYHKIIKTKEI